MRKMDAEVWQAFFQWIREEGARRGLGSVDAIAREAGTDGATLGRWAQSKNGPSLGALANVADALGVTMAQIGAAFDDARHPDGHPTAQHAEWPTFEEFVEYVRDLTPEEATMLRRTLTAVRAAKSGATTVIVT